MRKLLKMLKQDFYYFKKNVESPGKIVVIYNKNHPLYTVSFEEIPAERYLYVYVADIMNPSFLERILLNKAKVIHSDAPFFPFDFNRFKDKVIVAECEDFGKDFIYTEDRIKKIYIESKAALANNPKCDKIQLLYPGIKMQPAIKKPQNDDRAIVLTSVGYGGMIKGFDVIYKLYTTLKKEFNIKLIIAGSLGHNFELYPEITPEAYEAANFKEIQHAMSNDPDVTFGFVKRDQLFSSVYPKTDIYIQMSRMDTFGFTVLEAMSFGIPVLATSYRALPEMVIDGSNGFIVNDFSDDVNTQAWFDKSYNESLVALRKLISDKHLREEMGKMSRQYVAEKFEAQIRRRIVEADYDRFLKGN